MIKSHKRNPNFHVGCKLWSSQIQYQLAWHIISITYRLTFLKVYQQKTSH